jgi:hypothetical protein
MMGRSNINLTQGPVKDEKEGHTSPLILWVLIPKPDNK